MRSWMNFKKFNKIHYEKCINSLPPISLKLVIRPAFTLSDVLLTLLIISVIAVMTIPSLLKKTQDMECKAAAKKAFSTSAQVVMQMKDENGGNLQSYTDNGYAFKPAFIKYFKVLKDCNWNDCVPFAEPSDLYKTLAGYKASTRRMDDGQFITADGMLFCIENPPSTSPSFTGSILITVDVNGYTKGPNVFGRDVFTFQIKNDSLIPMGAENSVYPASNYCIKTGNDIYQGLGCMANVMNGIDY